MFQGIYVAFFTGSVDILATFVSGDIGFEIQAHVVNSDLLCVHCTPLVRCVFITPYDLCMVACVNSTDSCVESPFGKRSSIRLG